MAPEGLRKLRFFKRVLRPNSALCGFPGDLRAPLEPSEAREFGAKISLRSVHARTAGQMTLLASVRPARISQIFWGALGSGLPEKHGLTLRLPRARTYGF